MLSMQQRLFVQRAQYIRRLSTFKFTCQSVDKELYLQHLLLEKHKSLEAQTLLQQVQNGSDFESLINQHSICQSKSNSGKIGWIRIGNTLPSFQQKLTNSKIGDVILSESQQGIHLIKILDERETIAVGTMSVEELSEILCNPEVVEDKQLVDVREIREFELAKLPHFKLCPMSEFSKWVQDLDEDKETLVLCHHGMRSYQIASLLLQEGFRNVKNVEGGIEAYSTRVDPSVPRY
eukprot:TRINITY_DN1085_c0_g1_i1.p3 TRINITY_DN1085_c0_g1~~TRINITY_DN1085_c0_g1_i1.p3  ORF type:complete len:235 (+),score=9.49 TRINITY_DN1085_c0_g1_i1:160-864(+)